SAAPALAPSAGPPAGNPTAVAALTDRFTRLVKVERNVLAPRWRAAGLPKLADVAAWDDAAVATATALLDDLLIVEPAHVVERVSTYVPPLDDGAQRPAMPGRGRGEIVEGGSDVDADAIDALRRRYKALSADIIDTLAALHDDAARAGVSFHLAECRSPRRFEIVRALVAHDWARDADGAYLRAAVAHVVGQDYPLFPTIPLGAAIGSMHADEAVRFAALVVDPTAVAYGADGAMRLDLTAA
ncbi:MAG: hypothetical protein RJA49_3103, partial [Actinomycetota bacterium]